MAVVSRRSNAWILSLKVMLISIGVVATALFLKLFVPVMLEFAVSGLPGIWSFFRSWFKPPYLYFVINGIIITIAASSRFHQMIHDDQPEAVPRVPVDVRPEICYEVRKPAEISSDFGLSESTVVYEQSEARVSEVEDVVNCSEVEEDEEFVISRSTWTPPKRMDSSESISEYHFPAERPLVSSRFGHRKPVKASPEGGKALRVSKPKRHETLESTWKSITDGRAMPLTRHLRKSDTWENHGRQSTEGPQDHSHVNKSETFKDRTNNPPSFVTSSPGSGKLRKEPSLSQDELNRRVEAFIKKFNEEMRLQRQESLNQYREMINRGAH